MVNERFLGVFDDGFKKAACKAEGAPFSVAS